MAASTAESWECAVCTNICNGDPAATKCAMCGTARGEGYSSSQHKLADLSDVSSDFGSSNETDWSGDDDDGLAADDGDDDDVTVGGGGGGGGGGSATATTAAAAAAEHDFLAQIEKNEILIKHFEECEGFFVTYTPDRLIEDYNTFVRALSDVGETSPDFVGPFAFKSFMVLTNGTCWDTFLFHVRAHSS